MYANQKKKKKGKMNRRQIQERQKKDAIERQREISSLRKRVLSEAPPPGTVPILEAQSSEVSDIAKSLQLTAHRKFAELPISSHTIKALTEAKFTHLTLIQRGAISHALAGRDVLGAARTGSGKTLAFLVPVLENLYRQQWTQEHGLGALIISPTRELAVQIFEVLRKVGKYHDFSAGLVIGGKDFEMEKKQILAVNILVCTPGRLLHHMDHTYGFEAPYLQMLVLDEADRLLDMGFANTLESILQNLPSEGRQSLLFSATQTKSVKQLARLSLNDPQYASVHEGPENATPNKLTQHYMLLEAQDKLDMVWSFIKTHLRMKCLVFFSTCKQVQFAYEMFRRARPGIPLLHLHGKMKQEKRIAIYNTFCERKKCVLFATDIAGRGLDFPGVDWVVQADCPDGIDQYIHRVGRTARYRKAGKALLFLQPSEKAFLTKLAEKTIPVSKLGVNPKNLHKVSGTFSANLAEDPQLKYMAQKCFVAYVRSIHLQPDKEVFDVTALNPEALAEAYGLPGAPKLNLLRGSHHSKKNTPYELQNLRNKKKHEKKKTNVERLLSRTNQTVMSAPYAKMRGDHDDDDSDSEEFMTAKQVTSGDNATVDEIDWSAEDVASMMKKFEKRKKKGELTRLQEGTLDDLRNNRGEFNATMSKLLEMQDEYDKQRDQKRVHGKHKVIRTQKRKLRQEEAQEALARKGGNGGGVMLLGAGSDDDVSMSASSDADEGEQHRPTKKKKLNWADDEAMALALLG